MDYYAHIRAFEGISYFQAMPADRTLGNTIPHGQEKIEIILSGFGRYEFPASSAAHGVTPRSVRAGPGDIFWHTEGGTTLKDSDAEEPYRCMVFNFAVSRRPRMFSTPLMSHWDDLPGCSAFCWEVFGQYHRHTCDPDILGFYVYSRILWESSKSTLRQDSTTLPVTVQKMTKALNQSLDRDWTVRALGKAADISESHVYLLFRKHLKMSPHRYVLMHRLNKAKELLITTSMQVKQVCHACGFADAAHFTRLFRRRFAMTPLRYREKYTAQ